MHKAKFHRTVIIISTDGRNSDLQIESSLKRGLETLWSQVGGGEFFFTKLLIAGLRGLAVDG
jgi:hypothetical protein